MLELEIPGSATLALKHLVLDYNGTLALDGRLYAGVAESLRALQNSLQIHVVTADTFGSARDVIAVLPGTLTVLPAKHQAIGKQQYVYDLGPEHTACIGNGRNDHLMLATAALGIVVVQDEGAAMAALQSADIVCQTIQAALGLLLNPLRLTATLRT